MKIFYTMNIIFEMLINIVYLSVEFKYIRSNTIGCYTHPDIKGDTARPKFSRETLFSHQDLRN